jgi:hypothetical protein
MNEREEVYISYKAEKEVAVNSIVVVKKRWISITLLCGSIIRS